MGPGISRILFGNYAWLFLLFHIQHDKLKWSIVYVYYWNGAGDISWIMLWPISLKCAYSKLVDTWETTVQARPQTWYLPIVQSMPTKTKSHLPPPLIVLHNKHIINLQTKWHKKSVYALAITLLVHPTIRCLTIINAIKTQDIILENNNPSWLHLCTCCLSICNALPGYVQTYYAS